MSRTIQRAVGEKCNIHNFFFRFCSTVPVRIIGLRSEEAVFTFFKEKQIVVILNRKVKRGVSVCIGLVFFLEINLIGITVPFGVISIQGNILYRCALDAVQHVYVAEVLSACSLNKRKIGYSKRSDCFFIVIFATFFFQHKFVDAIVSGFDFNFGSHFLKIRIGYDVHSAGFHHCTVWIKRFVGATVLQICVIFYGSTIDFIHRQLQHR